MLFPAPNIWAETNSLKNRRTGESFNGATGPDGTVYYETVPRDALVKDAVDGVRPDGIFH